MVAIVCVCHKGDLELKSAFLIHSVKKYAQGVYKLYVAIPNETLHSKIPGNVFLEFCEKNKVETFFFNNDFLSGKTALDEGDLLSNKVYLWQKDFIEDYIMFLDSDTILFRKVEIGTLIKDVKRIAVKAANKANVQQWKLIYSEVEMKMPDNQILSSVSKEPMPPYFNSGVIFFNHLYLEEITRKWKSYYQYFSNQELHRRIGYPFYHRDQIALALAINSKENDFMLLSDAYNYPVRRKRIRKKNIPIIAHYHHPFAVYFETKIRKEFKEFLKINPEFVSEMGEIWKNLFAMGFIKEKQVSTIEYLKFKKNKTIQWLRNKLHR
jgi:hypothetical protein